MSKRTRFLLFSAATAAGAAATYAYVVRPWWRAWGVDAAAADRPLPGDDLVPDATIVDTREIELDAPPEAVWPWLLQMGYGRAGWYSYDAIDMNRPSAERIVPEWQSLAVGEVVPTHPAGGFEVRLVEPGRALVLAMDDALMRRQAEAAAMAEPTPANLRAAGAMMQTGGATWAVSWAFVLEPLGGGRTRFLERFRVKIEGGGPGAVWFGGPVMGFGVFLMMRKQMLGIRDRAERWARSGQPTAPAPEPESPAPEPESPAPEPEPLGGRGLT